MQINELIVEKNDSPLLPERYEFHFERRTIIQSTSNSLGKTTLIRFILHSLGFRVPSTRNIDMNMYQTTLLFENKNGKYSLVRNINRASLLSNEVVVSDYNLLNQKDTDALIMFVFGIENPKIVSNLLGCFYMDQDVGWTISNQGVNLTYNRFSILNMIASFIDNSLDNIDSQITDVNRDINKYSALYNLLSAEKKENDQNLISSKSLFEATYKSLKEKRSMLLSQKNSIKSRIDRLEKLLNNNEELVSNIEDYKILVKHGNEEPFLLTKELLYNYDINQDLLLSQINDKKVELIKIEKELAEVNIELKKNSPEMNAKEVSDTAIATIKQSDISPNDVKNVLDQLKKELASLKKTREAIIKSNNELYNDIQSCLLAIIDDLGHKERVSSLDLLTLNAKRVFSGIELSDICFAYTLACHEFAQKKLNIKMPMIIDSPGNGERKIANLNQLIDYLFNKIGDAQVIVSTAVELNKTHFDWQIFADGYIFEGHYKEGKPK